MPAPEQQRNRLATSIACVEAMAGDGTYVSALRGARSRPRCTPGGKAPAAVADSAQAGCGSLPRRHCTSFPSCCEASMCQARTASRPCRLPGAHCECLARACSARAAGLPFHALSIHMLLAK